jgi:ArsR family transcriptional regulator
MMTEMDAQDRSLCERQADFCGIFTNPVRIRIMLELGDGERSVGELAEALEVPLPNLSQHLRLMRDRGCVRGRKEGKHVYYAVTSPAFMEAMRLVRRGIEESDRQRVSGR